MSYLQQTNSSTTSVGNSQPVQLPYEVQIDVHDGTDTITDQNVSMSHNHQQQQPQQQVTMNRHNSSNNNGEDCKPHNRTEASSSNICNESAIENQNRNDLSKDDGYVEVSAVSNAATSGEHSGLTACRKTPNSYKYPSLKKYFDFGPWVGRNRRASCLACQTQSASSQPERLLKHLNRCPALNAEDKAQVAELMNDRTANKRKKPGTASRNSKGNDSDYYAGDEHDPNDSLVNNSTASNNNSHLALPSNALKRSRLDLSDRAEQIDEALTRWIIVCRIPLKTVHSKEFVELCRALNPDYRVPTREQITNVLIPGLLNII